MKRNILVDGDYGLSSFLVRLDDSLHLLREGDLDCLPLSVALEGQVVVNSAWLALEARGSRPGDCERSGEGAPTSHGLLEVVTCLEVHVGNSKRLVKANSDFLDQLRQVLVDFGILSLYEHSPSMLVLVLLVRTHFHGVLNQLMSIANQELQLNRVSNHKSKLLELLIALLVLLWILGLDLLL